MISGPDVLAALIRDVPDFPKPGVLFKDITPLLRDADGFRTAIDLMADDAADLQVNRVVGIEARGFILGAALAYRLGVSFVPVRKPGKLPGEVTPLTYELEYGSDTLEIASDGLGAGDRVLVVDDVLATGGTAAAAVALVDKMGAEVVGVTILMELASLGGRSRLEGRRLRTLVAVD